MKLIRVLLILLCFLSSAAIFGAEDITGNPLAPDKPIPNGRAGQYIFFFHGESLGSALEMFAKNNGLKLYISPIIARGVLQNKIVGKFTASDLNMFLTLLARQYGFAWFIYSDTLYITAHVNRSISIDIPEGNMSDVRRYLQNLGLLVDRFGYTELHDQNKVVVSGPPAYLDLVKNKIAELDIHTSNKEFAVFRLKYANAVDTTLTFNNQTITIPGVASLLQTLLGTRSSQKSNVSSNVQEVMKNRAESANSTSGSAPGEDIRNYSANPRITADARLNTIIIKDTTGNIELYRNIIQTLDIPAPLIQIDVLIIRLDQDKLAQKGINWWASSRNAAGGFGAANLTGGPTNNLAASYNQVNPGQLIVTNIASFSTSLQFLEDNQYAKTQAKPSLATIDNLPAMTNTVENIFTANTNAAVSNNTQQQNASTNLSSTGIQLIQSLQITPHVIVNKDNTKQIRLAIVLQDGSIDDFSNPWMPNYSQGYISSQAVIREGQSVILAGYTKNSNVVNETKVPGLGDIPFLGWFFKTKSSSVHRITTLYVVTPTIITDNAVAVANAVKAISNTPVP